MAEQSAKLQVSELDYSSIKSNLIAFLKSQSEFSNFEKTIYDISVRRTTSILALTNGLACVTITVGGSA